MPNLDRQPASTLLTLAIGLAGSLRYIREGESSAATVFLLGEIPCSVDSGSLDQAAVDRWLGRRDGGDFARQMPAEDVVADLLTQSGLACARRDAAWAIAPAPLLPREILVQPVTGGVKVDAKLTTWDAISAESNLALAEFLVAAQAGLRCARCELDSHSAHVICQIRNEDLGLHFLHGLRGVAAATQMLAREASALLDPELAHIYLELLAPPFRERTAIDQVDDRVGVIRPGQSVPVTVNVTVTEHEGG
jgi:hypothetical protein